MSSTISCDVAIVGGGLAGALIALALGRKRPDLNLRLIEASDRIGGNHVWSFFASDVAPADRWLVAPLISHGWIGYGVAFPGHARTIRAPYYAIESDRLDQVVRAALPAERLMLGHKVLGASPGAVVLANGDRVTARGVIDCRGPGELSHLALGWQKFLGRELRLEAPHSFARPMIMDARVEQRDGYRFVYALPFDPMRVFVEDTYYSDSPVLNPDRLRARVHAYAEAQGWRAERVVREESGVLPVAIGGDFEAYWQSGGKRIAKAGLRGGLFHPLTGYSLPDAVRTAVLVAGAGDYSGNALHDLLHDHVRAAWSKRGFYRTLAAMLFRAAEPEARYRVLERFYRLDERLIARFYAARSTPIDKMRVLGGKPPVPLKGALRAVLGTRK